MTPIGGTGSGVSTAHELLKLCSFNSVVRSLFLCDASTLAITKSLVQSKKTLNRKCEGACKENRVVDAAKNYAPCSLVQNAAIFKLLA